MRIVLYSQYYRCRDERRQREIDACLRANLNHPGVSRVVLFLESGAPPVTPGSTELELLEHDARLTYADWLRRLPPEADTIALLLNADIQVAEGLERLPACFDRPEVFLALSRYNPLAEGSGASLNDYPHWTQDCWGVRADAPIPPGLLHACGFPLGFPGCDNRIAHVMWSHGFTIKNPSYHVRTLHRHADPGRGYDKSDDRLYGGVTYVHPSLTPAEPSELEHAVWTRSAAPTGGLVINRQAVAAGVQSLLDPDARQAEPFVQLQRFTGLSWSRGALGSVHTLHPEETPTWPSEDTIFLPLRQLETQGATIRLRHPSVLEELCLRLPQHSAGRYTLELDTVDRDGTVTPLLAPEHASVHGRGVRCFLPLLPGNGGPHHELRLRLRAEGGEAVAWGEADGCELVLFGGEAEQRQTKSLRVIAEPQAGGESTAGQAAAPVASDAATAEPPRWRPRDGVDLEAARTLLRCGRRFAVRLLAADTGGSGSPSGGEVFFDDPFWPGLWSAAAATLPVDPEDHRALFLWGFGQPLLQLRPDLVSAAPRHGDHALHWWPGSRTEEDAWRAHRLLRGPQLEDGTLHLYLGLPWATFLENGHEPAVLLQAHRSRVEATARALREFGLALEVHSVCQHPRWRERPDLFEAAGVSTLWLSHKPRHLDQLGGLRLKPWHLVPFAGEDPRQRPLLAVKPPARRPFLASYQGEAQGLEPEPRQQLAALHHQHRWHVQLAADWPEESDRRGQAWERHDRILSDSVFSLCPPAAGANGERLWDSLAVGAIPVLLGDALALPDPARLPGAEPIDWEGIVLVHPPDQLASLPERLASLPAAEIEARSRRALRAHGRLRQATCFGRIEREALRPRTDPGREDPQRPTVRVPLHGPRDQWFWRQRKGAFHDIVLEWYLRGYINLRFHEQSYFWWGREGEILLFERDLIINLRDGKKDPPRWQGEVAYQHAFFGNQYHLPSARHHKITYWSYAPVLIEKLRQAGRRGWQQRNIRSLFAGSVENETQEYFRQRFQDWGEMIEIYACADRLNRKEPSPFALGEYMELVQRSRFGVSFHGNGPKCYREIEYMALGTPMILTEGLETDYPEPLQEGLHYRFARCREDIPRILRETGEKEWERMSRACWEWYGRNGTIDALFQSLAGTIAGLDLKAQRHQQVRIDADREAGSAGRAARSLAIVDPGARPLFRDDPGDCPLQLAADDLVIAELPPVGRERETRWRIGADEVRAYCQTIADSSHPAHKQLLCLVGVRLPHHTVRLEGPDGAIDPFDRLENGALTLRGPEERAILRTDFDWTRRCMMKYPDRETSLAGPVRLEEARITAVLRYRREEQELFTDLSPHFSDWYVAHGRLITPEELYRALKLWEYVGCELLAIRGRLEEGGHSRDFEYRLRNH